MEHFSTISNFSCVHKMFSSNDVLIGKIINSNIYFCVERSKKPDCPKDLVNVFWYYNNTNEPGLNDLVPFVDILDLVNEEVSRELIFNIDLFLNKGV